MYRCCPVLLLTTMLCSPAWSTVRIDVNYDSIANEIQPAPRVVSGKGGTTIFLNNNGTVTKNMNGGNSTNVLDGYVSSITSSGLTSVSHYKVSNGAITEFFENETLRETISISTNKAGYCTARAQFRPARGQRYIIWNRNPLTYASSVQAINVVCRIQKTD